MIDSINTVAQAPLAQAAPEATTLGQSGEDRTAGAGRPAAQPSGDPADTTPGPAKPSTRLLIDQDKATGAFIYRIVDVADGRLLAEIPRESVDQLKDADDYAAGALISTSA